MRYPGILSMALLTSACMFAGNAESEFACDAQLGVPCTSIQDADGVGLADRTLPEAPADTLTSTLSEERIATPKGARALPAAMMPDGGAPYHIASYRVPELLGTVWFAPRIDRSGLFHEASFVHFVIREAGWGRRSGGPGTGGMGIGGGVLR